MCFWSKIKIISVIIFVSAPSICFSELNIFATLVPQSYLLEKIGGDKVLVNILVKPGQNPHTYQPTPRQMIALGKSTIYFKIDAPFEKKILSKIKDNNKNLLIIDTAKGITKRKLDGHHSKKGELDPHIWLSPTTLKIQAKNIVEALEQQDVKNKKYYKSNYNLLIKDLSEVHSEIIKMLKPYKGRKIFVFHPAFGYFTDAYGLKQQAVEVGGKSPSPKQIKHLIKEAARENVKIIFVQPQFDSNGVKTIASAINGKVVSINPLGRDVINNLKIIAQSIRDALKK